MSITILTFEEALAHPDPKEIIVDGGDVYVLTGEDMSSQSNPVPNEINADQARLALLDAGLLSTVNDYVAQSSNDDLKIRWEYGGKLHRNSPYIASAGMALGLSDSQLDELFIRAAQK